MSAAPGRSQASSHRSPQGEGTPVNAHAVSRLRTARLAVSSKPYVARGSGLGRCPSCRLVASHCICALRPQVPTRAGVCLIMGDIEALKPSNTGWLIADVVADTWAFGWARTAVDPALLTLLADPQWQPYVVFPGDYVEPGRVLTALPPAEDQEAGQGGKRPLFILLDGTWSEARKMFRKSPYLDRLPVLSLHPEQVSNYRLRRSTHEHHFCTSEVAALCFELAGEQRAADTLAAWLDVFTDHYLSIRQQLPLDWASEPHQRLQALAMPAR
ncbi:MAG: DTW domain-containing protein [Gammaproteobacteria bacterium]|uniref:tRNA-uridine aminocarboxypropyltransferase n=1 Tax=Hydrogenophaga sp. TaxID=1904254 RepID=UPI000CAADDE2|nr:tRNA-uridine aminocarboxypropyltransferase [Hydrogenophaga sp.]MBU4182712.1 DTW domain-containing protein [Gammaproteobacteria bacterium]PKO76826.1 MAG: DTW domain-containing protein [Betaproteobacteria bacterium HGW-Betaproteobacteria-15]MBU4280433.1 DTW domain-containing protein [Gammaproteobacteria bacterium]MBU4325174.1 DTW domain-containing protein [Gammaproteobacteria bacterium]MCG2654310.1 DTW domain-containing protein [Hydrogenophaga sp.]